MFDFICGGELFQHLKNVDYFPEDRAKFYAAEILLALEFLHNKHIIYRDLKPENVLLDTEGHIKITDFGLAKQLETESELSKTSTFCGTDEYLAPEIILNEPYRESVDMWALGILIYEMITGWAPWRDDNRKILFEKIVSQPLDLSHPNLSPNAKDLLNKMLTKKISERIKTPEIKKHPFFSSMDFHKIYMKSIKPPFKPDVVRIFGTSSRNRQLIHRTSTRTSLLRTH